VRRIVAISAVALVAIVGAALVAVHLPFARARVLSFAARQLAARYDLDLRAARLDYNLLSRRVTFADVRLSARGHEEEPFFTARRVEVRLPWTVFRGAFAFNHVDLEGASVSMVRHEDGTSNVPSARGPTDPNRPPLRLDVRGLRITGLEFAYADRARDFGIEAGDLHADLGWAALRTGNGISGPLEIRKGVRLAIGDREIAAQPIAGAVAFDGSSVDLEEIGLQTAEGDILVEGRVERVLDRPALDLTFAGTTDVARAAAWGTLPVGLAGAAAVRGTIDGAAAEPTIRIQTEADALTIGRMPGVALTGQVTVTTGSLVVDKAELRVERGAVDAAATIPFDDGHPVRATASWRDLDARHTLRLLEQDDRLVAAAFTGTLQYERTGENPLTLRVANTTRAASASGGVPVVGDLSFTLADGRWQARQQHAVPGAMSVKGDLSGRVDGTAFSTATVDARLEVSADDVTRAAQAIERLGLDLPDIATTVSGSARAAVTLAGRFDALETRASVDSPALVLPGIAPAEVHAEVQASRNAVRVPTVAATIRGATLTGDASIDLQSRGLGGSFRLDAPDVHEVLTDLPAAFRIEGPIHAVATLGGTTAAPEVRADVNGENLSVSGQPIDTLHAKLLVLGDRVEVASLEARQREGSVSGKGSYAWGSRAYTADLAGSNLSWSGPLIGSTPSMVRVTTVRYAGAGTVDRPGGEATLAFTITGGVAGTLVGEGTATARFTGDTALVTARVPALGAFADAKIATFAPYGYDAIAVVNRIDLATLSPLLGAPEGSVSGSASLSATASGAVSEAASSRVFVNLQDLTAQVNGVPIALGAPSRLSWQGSGLAFDSVDVKVGQGALQASGEIDRAGAGRWDATFNGELADLVRMSVAFGAPRDLTGAGRLAARWQSMGGLDASSATLHLSNGSLAWGSVPPVTALALQASFDGRTITIPTLTGAWQEGGIEGSAVLPRTLIGGSSPAAPPERGHATLRVATLGAAAFEPWLGRETTARIQGHLSASLDADIAGATLRDLTATLSIDEAAFIVAGVDVKPTRPSRLKLEGGVLALEDVSWEAGGSPITMTGRILLEPAEARTVDLELGGDIDLRVLSAFAPTLTTDGRAYIDVRAQGPLSDPDINGTLELSDAGLAIRDPRIVVGQVNGPITLTGDSINFDGVAGTVNGGDLSLHGRLVQEGGTISGGQLVAQLQRVALEYPEGLLSEASALVTLTPAGTEWALGGDVRIERSSYTEPISVAALAAAQRSRPPAVSPSDSSWGERLRLNLFVVTEENLRIDNNYGRLEARGAVRLVGTAARPGLTGRVTIEEGGEFYLAGNTFFVERGSVTFTSPSRIQPEVDLQARGVVSGTDLSLRVSGTLEMLKTDVDSLDPNVSPEQARAALFGGLVGDQQALTLLSGELLGVTGRALGLDALRIEQGQTLDSLAVRADPTLIATETDPATRLTLSKRLSPEVELIFSQSLSESGAISAIISYKPRRNIEIRASSRDNVDRSIAIRHEITFGGGGVSLGVRPPQPRVSAVQIIGSPGRPEAEIRRELRLEEGDRYDFRRWQRDLDDMRERFLREGYFEAKIRARRQENPDGTLTLTYEMERGPRTSLVIEGFPIPDRVRRELEEAWTRIIFDRFLLDEIEGRILRHLVSEAYIGGTADARIATSTPEQKEIRVTVSPGTRVARLAFRYSGNAAFDEDRLDAVLQQTDPVDGWLDPPSLARAIEAFYRDQGYLAARATPGEPTIEGDSGVLTVLIEEGPRFAISNVVLNGVGDARRPAVEAAASPLTGAFFERESVERVVDQVDRLYLRQGFNDVRVENRAAADEAATTVTVAFDVQEGAQQVLRDVTIEGSARTRAGVLRRALRLRVGQPVDLEQWGEARRRLYDTNVFRQVDIEPVPMDPTPEETAAAIQPVRAVVRVIEYPPWRLRYGAQYREEKLAEDVGGDIWLRGPGVLADLQNQNLFGRAVSGGVALSYQQARQAGSLFAQNSSFFGLPVRSSAFVFGVRERDESNEFVQTVTDRTGISFEQRWRPFRSGDVFYGYRFERIHLYDPDPSGVEIPLDVTSTNGRITSAIYVDQRDDVFNASGGWFSSANFDKADTWLGADFPYTKVLLQQFYYRGIGRIVLASAARVGFAYRFENILPDDRFYAGGGTTVRGYSERSLGPRNILGDAQGGGGLLILNQEVRFPLFGRVGAVAFVDAGNVWTTRSEISLTDLDLGWGVGLRFDTPFALLRVDYGIAGSAVPPTRATGFTQGRFYFGIGQIF
jgi:outer membrane protein assembly complex protein YaeT